MASNRVRALRNVSTRLVSAENRLSYLSRRPAPRRLASNFINGGNIVRVAIDTPHIASDAVENENLANDAVDSDQIQQDAITGKNITSCVIEDSEINNSRMDTVEGINITLDQVKITNANITTSTLGGAEVVLTGCKLTNCTADIITGTAGSLSLVGQPVAVSGGFAVSDGSTVMTVASGAFGVGTGGGTLQIGGGAAEFSGMPYQNFTVSGVYFTPYTMFDNFRDATNATLQNLQNQINGKAPLGHSH